MRIARVLTVLGAGGDARQVLASDPRLVERGHTVRVFAASPEPGAEDLGGALGERGVEVVRVPELAAASDPLRRPLRWRAAAGRLQRLLADYGPEVVHTHGPTAGRLGHRAVERLQPVARVHSVAGGGPARPPRRGAAGAARSVRSADRVVVESHAAADALLELGQATEEQLVVVPPGAELAELLELTTRDPGGVGPLRQRSGVDAEAFLVGVIGELVPAARSELALDCFDLLAERHPRLQLVFLGDGPQHDALAELAGVRGGRVHLVRAPRLEISRLLGDLDAVLHTANDGRLPIELIEAAAAARPIVAAVGDGPAELLTHERTGFLGADAVELAAGLDGLLRNPRESRGIGQRCRLRAAERHSAARFTGRLEALYEVARDVAREARPCAS